MHELSLMSAVLDAITEQTTREHFSRVHRVSLEVGELCNVEVEALAFCFEVVMKGTVAEHASLDIRSVPGKAHCRQCRSTFKLSSRVDPCPSCGTRDVDTTGGDQITIKELEVA
jgi:hydrogenase nickel incorporation protein HypA/HybF